MADAPFELIDTKGLRRFVLARQKISGGVAATPKLPATVQDSFYALDILATIGCGKELSTLVDPAKMLVFFKARLKDNPAPPWQLAWFIHRSCLLLGLDPPQANPGEPVQSAEDLFYRNDLQPLKEEAPYPEYPLRTCRDRYYHLLLSSQEMEKGQRCKAADWFKQCQNHDGGFGFFPRTTSYIENSHYCLAALALLGRQPEYPQKAANFIIFSQTGRGGFSRNIRAAPFLDASWHAIRAITALAALKSGHKNKLLLA